MKISVEFENLEEIKDFSKAFLGEAVEEPVKTTEPAKTTRKRTTKKETKVEEAKEETKSNEPKQQEAKEEAKSTVTKEEVREICGRAIKAGKASETIAIVKNHGAAKVPDLKESEYEAVFNEVKELL